MKTKANYFKPGILLLTNELFLINSQLSQTAELMRACADSQDEFLINLAAERLTLLKEKRLMLAAIDA